jgi:DNA helicase-2/ATP-dependent DNA helicase PcrA
MEFSKYQNDFFAQSDEIGNLQLIAVAGSGKTFSLVEFMKRIKGNSIFLAFNKSIQEELSARVPSYVTASTLHSAGYKAIRKSTKGYIKVDNNKLSAIMQFDVAATSFQKAMSGLEKSEIFKLRKVVSDLVSMWKNTMIDFTNDGATAEIADHYGITFDASSLSIAKTVMQKSIAKRSVIDFDDMIYMPVANNFHVETYDNVFIDECQDLNRTQMQLVKMIAKKPNGRIIMVGDPRQSIYGFRGADTNAMELMRDSLNAKVLPLSVCYRCPKSHIELAKEIVPYIESAPNAIEGIIESICSSEFVNKVSTESEPLVLCRTNAPLVSYAVKMIREGKKATVRGTDIGKYLKSLVIGFQSNTIDSFLEKVDEWENAQLEQLNKRMASTSVKETICDYADVLRMFAEQCANPFDIANTIDRIFDDNTTTGTIFSSVHKAKGLEANVVYILHPEKLPLTFKNQKDWELDQEMNLKYVALTRSKNKLVFVNEK